MEKERIIEQLNKAENIIDKLRADLLNEEIKTKKSNSKTLKELAKECTLDDTNEVEEKPTAKKPFRDLNELNKQLEIKHLLQKYSCFNEVANEREFLEDIEKIIERNSISLDKLDGVLERIKYANDKNTIRDIKNYTYSCLHKMSKS